MTANVSWTVTDDQSWITTSPTSGTNNGSFSVSATANTGTASRSGTVTVSGGGITRTVGVSQAGTTSTSVVYQTESGTVGGGTVFESSNGGFIGTGYVNASATGGFSQNSNVDGRGGGSKTLRIRFALGVTAARTGRLVVNGVASNITFNGDRRVDHVGDAERHRDAQQQHVEHDPLRVDRPGPGEHRPDRDPLANRGRTLNRVRPFRRTDRFYRQADFDQ